MGREVDTSIQQRINSYLVEGKGLPMSQVEVKNKTYLRLRKWQRHIRRK